MLYFTGDTHGDPLRFLEWIMYEVRFEKWFFGHWHFDGQIGENFRALWFDVVQA